MLLKQSKASEIVKRYDSLKQEKYVWNIHYQVVAEYYLTRKADFVVNFVPGTFLNRDLFDSTGPKASNVCSGALLGMLWPEEATNFKLKRPRHISDSQENKTYYDEISYRLHDAMSDPQCGLTLSLTEFMRDLVNFGTCGVGTFEPNYSDSDCHFLFQAWDIKRMVIEEGLNGFVNRVYYEREEILEKVAAEFGLENLSEKLKKAYENKQYDMKVRFICAIDPRTDRNPDGKSVFDMPVSATYIELGENHILKETGYESMPVFVCRLMKNIRERYGRSFAMDALPDVLELNALREAEIVATEKMLDPPLAIMDDGRLGAGTVDTSAGAINVFNVTGRIGNQPPIFPIVTIGELKAVKERIEELKQSVAEHFLIDRLLDMQNDTEMTLGEVMERQKLRAFVLNPYFTRIINEVFSPLIIRCFNMLLKKGYLGVMPGSQEHQEAILFGYPVLVIPAEIAAAMLRGENVYDIQYLTPAARMLQTQLASGIFNTWKFMNDVAQTQPEVYDNVDEDISVVLISGYEGAPSEILRSTEAKDKIRAARAQAQAQAQKKQDALETMKAMGHLKGLAPPPGAPGVVNESIGQPIAV